jgi:hypothetical protein
MKGGLISVVYVSSAFRKLSNEEILEILRKSQENNQRREITGMLLYHDGNFMQALEGPEPEVDELMRHLEGDDRHRGLIVLDRRPITERHFPKWSMAFKDLTGIEPSPGDAYSDFFSNNLLDERFRAEPDLAYRLLLHFKQNSR